MGRKLPCCCKSFPPLLSDWRWLQGEAHFPVSRVSQLTKNPGFPVCITSRLTDLRNFPPIPNRWTGRSATRSRIQQKGEQRCSGLGIFCRAPFFVQKESQSWSMRLDTTALRYSLNRAVFKPHELHIVPFFMSSGWVRKVAFTRILASKQSLISAL